MTTRATRLTSIFLIWAAMEAPAIAYLDGATGSILLQAAIGLFASWMVYFRLFKEKARSFFQAISGRAKTEADSE